MAMIKAIPAGTSARSGSIVLLALLLCVLFPLSSCRRLSGSSSIDQHHHRGETVFNIPAFQVNLTVDVSSNTQEEEGEETQQLPLLDVSTTSKLKSATVSYLFDYIESILEEEEYSNNGGNRDRDRDTFISPLENINLEVSVSVHTKESNNYNYVNSPYDSNDPEAVFLVAEMAGDVSFTSTKISENYIITQEKVTIISITAFLGSMAMNDYKSRIQSILPKVLTVRVQSHSKFSSFDEDGDNHLDKQKDGGGGKGKGDGSVGAVGVFLLVFTFISAAILLSAWLYKERQVKRFGRRSRNGHLLMDTEQYSDGDYYDQDGDNDGGAPYFTGLESDGSCDDSLENNINNEPIQFIPVPARFDEVTNGRKSAMAKTNRNQHHTSDITPRRYVSTASPFDLLYGAAFSHSEKAKVQSAHGMKKQKPSSSSSSSSHRSKGAKTTRQLKPLNTITEVNEEEHGAGTGVGVGTGESFFPQIMSTISSFITSGTSSKDQGKEDFVVFRDFPRHDGTPCIMFDGVGAEEEEDNKTPPKAAFQSKFSKDNGDDDSDDDDDDDDEDISHASSDSSVYVDGNKENIDCFVDKLENLIAARSRQYEERKKMDIELVERKKIRAEQRKREREIRLLHSNSNSKDSSGSDNDSDKGGIDQEPSPTLFSDVSNISSNEWNTNSNRESNNKEQKIQSSNTHIDVTNPQSTQHIFDARGPDAPPMNDKENFNEVDQEIQEKALVIEKNEGAPKVQPQSSDNNNVVTTDKMTSNNLVSPRDVETLHFEENTKLVENPGASKEEKHTVDVIIQENNEVTTLV